MLIYESSYITGYTLPSRHRIAHSAQFTIYNVLFFVRRANGLLSTWNSYCPPVHTIYTHSEFILYQMKRQTFILATSALPLSPIYCVCIILLLPHNFSIAFNLPALSPLAFARRAGNFMVILFTACRMAVVVVVTTRQINLITYFFFISQQG